MNSEDKSLIKPILIYIATLIVLSLAFGGICQLFDKNSKTKVEKVEK